MDIDKLKSLCLTPLGKKKVHISDELYNELFKIFNFTNSRQEMIFCLKHDIFKNPVCPTCGKTLKFLKSKDNYQHHCSKSCALSDLNVRKKFMSTIISRYGSYENFIKENKQKAKLTCLRKYNSENYLGTDECIRKSKETRLKRYGNSTYSNPEKAIKTCIERYGSGRNNDKIKQTMLKRYGETSFLKTKQFTKYRNNKEAQAKIQETKRKNNTFNKSASEDFSYKLLLEKYNDVIRQYKSELYPFNCDFYIPSLDLYIECNYHWTHGGHLFDKNDINDLEKVNKWKRNNSKFYNNAINTWTVRDVEKCNIAVKNNINIKYFYSLDDFKKFLSSI